MKPIALVLSCIAISLPGLAFAQSGEEVIIRVEPSQQTVNITQPLDVEITILVPTWLKGRPGFPSLDQQNLIARFAGSPDGSVREVVNGEDWFGSTQRYQLFPMAEGQITIPAKPLTFEYMDPESAEPTRVTVQTSEVQFDAIVPAGAENLQPMIVAESLELEQVWEGPEGALQEGDALTREITATVSGSSALFLPEMLADWQSDLIRAYPLEPRVVEGDPKKKATGTRTESASYVARYGGVVTFPEISVRWFNTQTNTVEATTVPARTVEIDAPAAPVDPLLTKKQVIVLGGFLALMASVAWVAKRWVWPAAQSLSRTLASAWKASERYAALQVTHAIDGQDLRSVFSSFKTWIEFFPQATTEDFSDFERVVLAIGQSKFQSGNNPNWEAVASSFQQLRQSQLRKSRLFQKRAKLPSLNPF